MSLYPHIYIPEPLSNPKYRPYELTRQRRLLDLYTWGKAHFTESDLFDEEMAVKVLQDRALAMFGVALMTANNYAKVVFYKLREENGKSH